jgi:hypothetical protein
MLMKPVINNNGTSRKAMIKMRLDANRAVHAAMTGAARTVATWPRLPWQQ